MYTHISAYASIWKGLLSQAKLITLLIVQSKPRLLFIINVAIPVALLCKVDLISLALARKPIATSFLPLRK